MRWGHRPRVPCWCRVCDAWHAASPVPGLHQVLAGPRTPPVIPTRKFHKTKITAGPLSPLPGSPWRSQPTRPQVPFLRPRHNCGTSILCTGAWRRLFWGPLLPTGEGRGLRHTQAWGSIPTV